MTNHTSTAAALALALATALLLNGCGGVDPTDTSADDLSADKKKACKSDSNCSSSQVCQSGVCKARPPPPPVCAVDADCPAGDVCQSGACVAGTGDGSDGAPVRTASCTPLSQQKGTLINTNHGRLDGYVRYVVPKGGPSSCNGDSGHIHVQVSVAGDIYDVAVDVGRSQGDANFYEADLPLPDGAWSEGWHGSDGLSYTALGVHASQFAPQDPATLGQTLQAELATANHISVFGIAYSSHNGAHDIHYYNGNDGALVLRPLSAKPHVLFFRFANQSF